MNDDDDHLYFLWTQLWKEQWTGAAGTRSPPRLRFKETPTYEPYAIRQLNWALKFKCLDLRDPSVRLEMKKWRNSSWHWESAFWADLFEDSDRISAHILLVCGKEEGWKGTKPRGKKRQPSWGFVKTFKIHLFFIIHQLWFVIICSC